MCGWIEMMMYGRNVSRTLERHKIQLKLCMLVYMTCVLHTKWSSNPSANRSLYPWMRARWLWWFGWYDGGMWRRLTISSVIYQLVSYSCFTAANMPAIPDMLRCSIFLYMRHACKVRMYWFVVVYIICRHLSLNSYFNTQ